MNDPVNPLQESLRARWEGKLPLLLHRARNFASAAAGRLRSSPHQDAEKAIREAYTAGYREGYWEGVCDTVECEAHMEHPLVVAHN